MQMTSSLSPYVPALQMPHESEPVSDAFPAGHALHAAAPVREKVPLGQVAQ